MNRGVLLDSEIRAEAARRTRVDSFPLPTLTPAQQSIDAEMRKRPGGAGLASGRSRNSGEGLSPLGSSGWVDLDPELSETLDLVRQGALEVSQADDDAQPTPYRRPLKPWATIRHGTASAYRNDCRRHPDGACDHCKAAHAAYTRSRRAAKESARA